MHSIEGHHETNAPQLHIGRLSLFAQRLRRTVKHTHCPSNLRANLLFHARQKKPLIVHACSVSCSHC